MSDDDMPDAPWWSQPGTTAVHPHVEQPTTTLPPYQPPSERKQRKGAGTATLIALALVLGGAAGGGVATYFDDDIAKATSGSTQLSGGTVTAGSGKTVSGTPEAAAATIGPSVVTIEVTGTQAGAFGNQAVSGTGSGVIIRDTGYIVTNNHVVDAAAGGAGTVHVTFADGDTVPATIVGTDSTTDLAVVKVDKTGLKAATFAQSENLKVGQAVLAVGAPLGLSNTVTQGIVSTLHRPVATGNSSSSQAVIDAVQTDAAINPGNSGGALVDLAGRVVGINSAIASTGDSSSGTSGNIGVGFAIPSETATKVADQLISTGKAVHSQIGVGVGDAAGATDGAPGLGATIRSVKAGAPADKAGLQSGDIVTKVNDRAVTDSTSLIAAIRSYDPGTTVTLTYIRGGATKTLKVTLASADDR